MNETIPFVDLVTPHRVLENELHEVFRLAMDSAGFIGGSMVNDFERSFADFCGTKHCIGVSSGTDALLFALLASGIKPGDIVITVPNTFVATVEAIIQSGAIPDFVDVEERSQLMDPEKLKEYIEIHCRYDRGSKTLVHKKTSRRVRGIIPVHLYGFIPDMDALRELADEVGLVIIEDACQAHGAKYYSKRHARWEMAGSMGCASAFSFYPGKNLGACGDAGAVTTDSDEIASKIRMLRDHGQAQKYYHEIEGYNGRLDAIQAGFLAVKLKRLELWTEKRREVASWYRELLGRTETVLIPYESMDCIGVYHLYVIRTLGREQLRAYLTANGVSTGLHYPLPLHAQNCLIPYEFSYGSFPVAERLCGEILSLPMFPDLRRDQVETVCRLIQNYFITMDQAKEQIVLSLNV